MSVNRARRRRGEESGEGLIPSPVCGSLRGVTSGKFFENIGANLCNLVHFSNFRSGKWKLFRPTFDLPILARQSVTRRDNSPE